MRRHNDPSACTHTAERRDHVSGRDAQLGRQARYVDAIHAAIRRKMIELRSPLSMRSARIQGFARACGAASALTAAAPSSQVCACGWRPLHKTCRVGVDDDRVARYSANVFSGVFDDASPPGHAGGQRTDRRTIARYGAPQELHRLLIGEHGHDRDRRRARRPPLANDAGPPPASASLIAAPIFCVGSPASLRHP